MSTFGQHLQERRAAFAAAHGRPPCAAEEASLRQSAQDDLRAAEAVRQERNHERAIRNAFFGQNPGVTEQEWERQRPALLAAPAGVIPKLLTLFAIERQAGCIQTR